MFGTNKIVGKSFFKDAKPATLLVTSIFFTLQGEGPYMGEPAAFVRLAKCNLACGFCFPANVKITMAKGKQKKIKDIAIGDEVISFDEKSQLFVTKKVTKTFVSETDELICITRTQKGDKTKPGNQTFCTPNHPFLVKNKGWVEAKDLISGDVILHLNSSDCMKIKNPMKNPETAAKVSSILSTIEYRKRNSDRMVKTWAENPKMLENHSTRMLTNNPMKNPETALKGFLSRKEHKTSGIEKSFEIATIGMPIEYVGDGKLTIGYKIPDFVVKGQKKVIEVWDCSANFAKKRNQEWMSKRAAHFKKYGYETLFLPMPPSGIKTGLHDRIRRVVASFINNGEIVHSTHYIKRNSGKAWTRFAGEKDKPATVYNFEVEDTHTYIADGKIVHNCDTYFETGDVMTFAEIFSTIDRRVAEFFKGEQIPPWAKERQFGLVVSGGEPSLQDNLSDFLEIAALCNKDNSRAFKWTQIETNGISYIETPWSTKVVSPKCLEKDGVAVRYLTPNDETLEDAACLKFVLCDPSVANMTPYSEIPAWALKWSWDNFKPIYISPMNMYLTEPQAAKILKLNELDATLDVRSIANEVVSFWEPGLLDLKANELNHKYAANYCLEYGLNLNLQMHLYAGLA